MKQGIYMPPLLWWDEVNNSTINWTANQQIHSKAKSFFFSFYLTAEVNRPNSTQMHNQLRLWGRSASNLPVAPKLTQAFSNLGEEKCFLLGSLLQSVVKLENQMLRVYVMTHLSITHSSLPWSLLLPPLCSDSASRCNEFISANSAHRRAKSPFVEVRATPHGWGPGCHSKQAAVRATSTGRRLLLQRAFQPRGEPEPPTPSAPQTASLTAKLSGKPLGYWRNTYIGQ